MPKKIIAAVLALMLLMGLCSVASAAGNGSITIKIPADQEGRYHHLYTRAYRIFDAVENGQGGYIYSTTNAAARTALESVFDFTEQATGDTIAYIASLKAGKSAADIAAALETANLADISLSELQDSEGKEGTEFIIRFENLEPGYYYITGTYEDFAPIIVTTVGTDETVVITQKTEYPSFTISPANQTADYGQTVPLTLNVTIPQSSGKPGFHIGEISIVMLPESNLKIATYTEATLPVISGGTITGTDTRCTLDEASVTRYIFTIPADVVEANYGQTLTFEVNVIKGDDVTDTHVSEGVLKAYLANQNFWSTEQQVTVNSHEIEAYKYDNGDPTKGLEGAKFVLQYKSSTNENHPTGYYQYIWDNHAVNWVDDINAATAVKTTASGNFLVYFTGLANGTYTLIETEAPQGYTLMENIDVVVEDGNVHLDVDNKNGGVLPSTGGIGTTLFYVIGAALMLGALTAFMTKRKMKQEG